MDKRFSFLFALFLALASVLRADLSVPALFSDHMVLQRDQANKIWGWDDPGTRVTVSFDGKKYKAKADESGAWSVTLDPGPANAQPQTLAISGSTRIKIEDVLVGEVWLCSGQSNMRWDLRQAVNGDLAGLAANYPQIRLISVPNLGTQDAQKDFKGNWQPCSTETVASFSAIGYYFGEYLHRILDVPVGLIDNSWGGSAAEAWVDRERLAAHPKLASIDADWKEREAHLNSPAAQTEHQAAVAVWEVAAKEAEAAGKWVPRKPRSPEQILSGNHRLGNLYNGVLNPIIGYGIKGATWYQGESNTSRAEAYKTLFPFMIENWRADWGIGDFPFYWVQLADFLKESETPQESDWAALREAQTETLKLPNTGQAIIIDLGEERDIHPRDKFSVASRLVRWALVKDYGYELPYRSPEFESISIEGDTATIRFDTFGSSLKTFDSREVKGFAICGEDREWHWAEAEIVDDETVEVRSQAVPQPIAVRYAWASNPVCNLISNDDLPATPFRTDEFPAAK